MTGRHLLQSLLNLSQEQLSRELYISPRGDDITCLNKIGLAKNSRTVNNGDIVFLNDNVDAKKYDIVAHDDMREE